MSREVKRRAKSAQLVKFARELREQPGVWQRVPTRSSSARHLAYRINSGLSPALPPELYEARSTDGVAYARYKGEEKNV